MHETSASLPLGGGLEAFRGFYSSVRAAHNQLMVNVDGEYPSVFIQAPVIDVMLSPSLHCGFLQAWKHGWGLKGIHEV
jgi:hypothetical protein